MKVGFYGSAAGEITPHAREQARSAGRRVAELGGTIVTGACKGLPKEAVLGCYEVGGQAIGFSPATSLDQHIKEYNLPTEGFTNFFFVLPEYRHAGTLKICHKYRNVDSVAECDAAVFIGGRIGSMNEFTNAYDLGKKIGVLKGTGGITERAIEVLLEDAKKESQSQVIFNSNPVELINKLFSL